MCFVPSICLIGLLCDALSAYKTVKMHCCEMLVMPVRARMLSIASDDQSSDIARLRLSRSSVALSAHDSGYPGWTVTCCHQDLSVAITNN